MVARLGLTGPQMRQIEMYACIEPVGEAMADYGGEAKPPPASKPALDIDLKARLGVLAKQQRRELKQNRRQRKRKG